MRRGDVCGHKPAGPSAKEGDRPEPQTPPISRRGIAFPALAMKAGEEVSGAGGARGLMEEQTIGAEGLKTVMLHDNFFAQNKAQDKRAKRGSCDMDKV